MTNFYAAKAPVNHEVDLTSRPITTSGVQITYRTDPEVAKSILPGPLEPADDPIVRLEFQNISMANGLKYTSSNFTIAAKHEETVGSYCLLMPQPTDVIVVGGRETFGEPKKLSLISMERNGDHISANVSRYGTTIFGFDGRAVEELETSEDPVVTIEYYFKYLLNPDGTGVTNAHLVHCEYDRVYTKLERLEGEFSLLGSLMDPVNEIPIVEMVSMKWFERRSRQTGRIRQDVAQEDILPFIHHKYDDFSKLTDLPQATSVKFS